MKIGFVVNSIETEFADFTTTELAMNASNLGHEVWYIGVSDFTYDPHDLLFAHARSVRNPKHRSLKVYLDELQSSSARRERILVDDLDILFLRNDPSLDAIDRPWARLAGINFGRYAKYKGVLALNDPDGLAQAVNKMYLQYFPEHVRPLSLITRDRDDIKHFIKEQGGRAVLKPLAGSGGRNVFLIEPEEHANINQIIDAVSRDGYVIAEEFLPEAVNGDTRLFLMDGKPLVCGGKYAAFRRVRGKDNNDIRSNLMAGGVSVKANVNDGMLQLAEDIRPKLVEDGMFLVGLDIVSDKLLEINVFTPGGLWNAAEHEGVNFSQEVMHALEHKVRYIRRA